MSFTHDPTNAHAVAGSSKYPYTPPAVSDQPGGGQPPPPPPSLPRVDPTSTQPQPVPTQSQQTPRRRADGPIIVPTVVNSQDGVREVPQLFEHCQVEDLIALIASMLDRLIEHNDRIPLTPNSLTRFHSRAPPSIGVRDYLLRIARYTNVEPCCLLILLPYVDKVCARMNTFTISSLTVHRFIIAAVSVGSKALSDAFCTNGRYARVGGVSVVEMNLLEKEFCEAIDWRLTTSGTVLAHYYTSLVRSHPSYRLSTAPLPEQNPPPPAPSSAPVLSVSSENSSPATTHSTTFQNGSTTPHSSRGPSVSPSTSSGMSTSASSSSMSIDPSPALSSTSFTAANHPPPPARPPSQRSDRSNPSRPSSSSLHPKNPLLSPSDTSSTNQGTTSTPPLVPPNLSRRFVSASNLPSPAPQHRSNSNTNGSSSSSSRNLLSSSPLIGEVIGGGGGEMLPPASPAKRDRTTMRRSNHPVGGGTSRSSSIDSSASSASSGGSSSVNMNDVNGGGGGEIVGTRPGAGLVGKARFAPSPRLSAES